MNRRPFSLALRLFRERQGITQRELAKRVEIAQPALAAIESGARGVSEEMLERIARGYELDAVTFLARAFALALESITPPTTNERKDHGRTIEIPFERPRGCVGRKRCKRCRFLPCYCGERARLNPFGPLRTADALRGEG